MTRNSQSSTKENDEIPDPDEVCGICGETRENHGDKHHKFSADGQLVALEKGPPRRADPPRHRDEPAIAFATLLEVLTEKGILDAKDCIRILTGQG